MRKNQEKNKEYQRKWYLENKKIQIERTRLNRLRIRKYILDIKRNSKCEKCGENHIATLDFHHKDKNQKELNLAKAHVKGWSFKKIDEEISKCIILCSNCHRKLHYSEGA